MKNKAKEDRGVVLVIVVIAIAMLSTIVVDFIYSTHINYEVSTNNIRDIQAGYIARSGVNVVKAAMRSDNLENIARDVKSLQSERISTGNDAGHWELSVSSFPVGDGFVSITVLDERAKLNLNSLVNQSTNQVDFQVLTALNELFRYLEIDSDKSDLFISSLINWLDHEIVNTQNDQDPNGAAASYYSSLQVPYIIKDGPLDSLDEVKLIHGMDEEFFEIIRPYVTVYTKNKKINLSTAPKIVILAALKAALVPAIENQGSSSPEDLNDDTAEQIADAFIEEREESGVITRVKAKSIIKDIDSGLNISSGLSGMVLNTGFSRTFFVRSTGLTGEVDATFREVSTVLYKTGLAKNARLNVIAWKER
ncbi:MAG: hypothetical protein GTO02_06480 [Candidatus Dadabacteria bacterium]|nr:hypothetical protein [Candidatus Dadabacteria bacterium]NIQ14048.1 hypothetical protein [Candidatus Dadabacteria bacterium]